eukprot:352306-Chlamydomonas_euryale.AAC.2
MTAAGWRLTGVGTKDSKLAFEQRRRHDGQQIVQRQRTRGGRNRPALESCSGLGVGVLVQLSLARARRRERQRQRRPRVRERCVVAQRERQALPRRGHAGGAHRVQHHVRLEARLAQAGGRLEHVGACRRARVREAGAPRRIATNARCRRGGADGGTRVARGRRVRAEAGLAGGGAQRRRGPAGRLGAVRGWRALAGCGAALASRVAARRVLPSRAWGPALRARAQERGALVKEAVPMLPHVESGRTTRALGTSGAFAEGAVPVLPARMPQAPHMLRLASVHPTAGHASMVMKGGRQPRRLHARRVQGEPRAPPHTHPTTTRGSERLNL